MVYRGTTSASNSASLLGTVTGTTDTDTSAAAGTTYYYWVTAADSATGTNNFNFPAGPVSGTITAPVVADMSAVMLAGAENNPIAANNDWAITITGSGFGTKAPFVGTSSFLAVHDETQNFDAGYISPGAIFGDGVNIKVTNWTDSEITITGFSGADYGTDYNARPGDTINVTVYNASTDTLVGTKSTTLPGFTVSNQSLTGATVSWTAATDFNGGSISSYVLEYETHGSAIPSWTSSGVTVSGTTATIAGLSPGQAYDLHLAATDNPDTH